MVHEGHPWGERIGPRDRESFPPAQRKGAERAGLVTEEGTSFETIVLLIVLEELLDDLEVSVAADRETTVSFQNAFAALNEEHQKRVLALPFELRQRRLTALFKETKGDGCVMIHKLLKKALEEGWTLGYHLSPVNILPREGRWTVRGLNVDGRDGAPMAHCSLDGDVLYLRRPTEYLYVVRVLERHARCDTTGRWVRANGFSIVSQIRWGRLLAALEEQKGRAGKQLDAAAR